jgi:hypothetical protein
LPPGQTASEASVNPRRDSIVLSGLSSHASAS